MKTHDGLCIAEEDIGDIPISPNPKVGRANDLRAQIADATAELDAAETDDEVVQWTDHIDELNAELKALYTQMEMPSATEESDERETRN